MNVAAVVVVRPSGLAKDSRKAVADSRACAGDPLSRAKWVVADELLRSPRPAQCG